MPQYNYRCQSCDGIFQLFSSIADYNPSPSCPECSGLGQRYFNLDKQTVFDGEPRTLGALADRNSNKRNQ